MARLIWGYRPNPMSFIHYPDRSKSQKYFADIAGVSDVTIKNRSQELRTQNI
jgi:transcription initiation factor TFIIIB Brf1 subunit/transcription initiation factor TFIIB